MKLFHVATKYDGDIKLPQLILDKLPSHLILMGTTQFSHQMPAIKKQIEATGRKVELFRGVHDVDSGQILGCDIFKGGKQTNASMLAMVCSIRRRCCMITISPCIITTHLTASILC